MKRILPVAVLLALASVPLARGCDLCAVYAATRAEGLAPSAWSASAAAQFTDFGTLRLDGDRVPNPANQWLDSTIAQLVLSRGFTERFAVQVNLPFIDRGFRRPENGGNVRGRVDGLGDASVLLRGAVVRREGARLTVLGELMAGAKFPTGSTARLREELDEAPPNHQPFDGPSALSVPDPTPSAVHGHDLTLGSGATDLLIGTQWYVRAGRFYGTGSVQYAVRRRGDYGYRFANDLTWEAAPGAYLLLGHRHTLGLQAVISGEKKGLDDLNGVPAEDTGLTAVYAGPRLTYTTGTRLSAQVGADFPVHVRNTALQVTPTYRLRGAASWNF